MRYEDLTADPRAATQRVCAFLGVQWEPAMLDYGRFDHGRMKPGLGDWKAKIKSGAIQPAEPPPPLDEIHPSLHELCVAWGYEPAPAVQPAPAVSAPKVTVVVPVYNPGARHRRLHPLAARPVARRADEYEVIFVDDGSTDATPARLDALAAEHAHVRVEHIPNSGWPGRPRNVGIELARGEYVFFVDNDDWHRARGARADARDGARATTPTS